MVWVTAALAVYGAYTQHQQAKDAAEEQKRQNEIARKRAQEEANKRLMQYMAIDNNITAQQRELNQAMSDEMSQIAVRTSEKQASVEVSLGERGITGALAKRLKNQLENKQIKEQGAVEYKRRSAIRGLQVQKQASYYNAEPPTVYLGTVQEPSGWQYAMQAGLGAYAAYERGNPPPPSGEG